MATAAEAPWPALARQTLADLQPAAGRTALTWKVALLCALVAAVAMLYRVPEAAIGCYLIIFLSRPGGAACVQKAIGIIVLVSVVILLMAPLIEATADNPLLRISIIALVSFGFVFLGAASKLGEQGSIVALVIAFVLTLVDRLPIGEIATRGLLYAWQMAVMPMVLLILFSLVFGASPQRLLRQRLAARLDAAAKALGGESEALEELLGEGLAEGDEEVAQSRLFHTAPAAEIHWLAGAHRTSYRLLLAVAALPAETAPETRALLEREIRQAADAIRQGKRPPHGATPEMADAASRQVATALAALTQADGGTHAPAPKPRFLKADALANPDYTRYALKTTAAAILCYLTYSLIGWPGIHTAMVTCYVAALGTMAETVRKLALRIAGCLVGAALGILSILFVIPHLESVGGLMALVFIGLLPAAWVAAGSERISYAGVQIGLAFLLTVLDGFGPSLDLATARDRVVGVLLGNLVVYLIFTTVWPKSAVRDIREHLARALAALAQIAGLPPEARTVDQAAAVATQAQEAREQMLLLPLEPAAQLPARAGIARLWTLIDTSAALLPLLFALPDSEPALSERLAGAAGAVTGAPLDGTEVEAAPLPREAAPHVDRIEHLVRA